MQTISAVIPAGTAFSELGRFAGTPDNIDLWASAAGMEVKLADVALNEDGFFNTQANANFRTYMTRRIVLARDPAGTGGQTITAVGKWAEPND